MSELKAFNSSRIYWAVEQVEREPGDIDELHLDDNLFCLKSDVDAVLAEKDKALRHQKYKRCLTKAKLCAKNVDHLNAEGYIYEKENQISEVDNCIKGTNFYHTWYKRWLKIANKFKERR